MTRNCTTEQIKVNQDLASNKIGGKKYAAVPVLISATGSIITFSATNISGGISSYTAVWGDYEDMFAACPSNVPCSATVDDAGPPPAVGASGNLYLSDAYFARKPTLAHGTPKWPRSLGDGDSPPPPEYAPLRIWTSTMILNGIEVENTDQFIGAIDMLDPNMVQPGQQITLERDVLTIMASKAAFAQFGVRWDGVVNLRAAIKVINSTTKDPSALSAAWRHVADLQRRAPAIAAPQKRQLNELLEPLGLSL